MKRLVIAAALALAARGVWAAWSPAWTNGSMWASYALVRDLKAAVDERHAVVRPYLGHVQLPPATPGLWPSVYWLGVVDLWLMRSARLLRAPSENDVGSSANCYFLDPYLASGTSYESAFRTNASVWLTWTNAMRYAGLTNTFNFTRPTWVYNRATATWATATNRPFWLRRDDLEERRRVLNLLRWTRETETTGGTNVWHLKSLPNAFESPSFPSCDENAPVQELPTEYAWTNMPGGDAKWTIQGSRDYDDTPVWMSAGIASRMDGIGRSATGDVSMVILKTLGTPWTFPGIYWPSNYFVSLSQLTNYASATDIYAQWETNALAAVNTHDNTKVSFDNRPYIASTCSKDWTPASSSQPRTNSQPAVTWSALPLAYTLENTATKPRGVSKAVVRGTNVPDHADLVLTHRKHEYQTVFSGVTNTVEQLAVIAPVWQEDLASPADGPALTVIAVSRWDVTNGFDKVGPLP